MRCAIWHHLCNLKNMKNTHGEVLLLVKLQAKACNFTKVTLFHGCFSRFLNCLNDTKSQKTFYKSAKIILGSVLMLWTQLAS